MNSKILLASFCLVFLAELGDKTQLTALAFSASSRSPWSVFLGTSLALVLTTAIAVVFGEVLSRHLPEKVLHIASGVMFVLVGLVLLVNQARKAESPAGAAAGAPGQARVEGGATSDLGLVSGLVLHQAIHFENELADDLREQASRLNEGELRQSLLQIADEDARHARALAAMVDGDADDTVALDSGQPGTACALPDTDAVRGEAADILERLQAAGRGEEDDPVRVAVRRQEAAAEFYIALARLTPLHSARDTLRWLSMEEIRHAQHLCSLINHAEYPEGTG